MTSIPEDTARIDALLAVMAALRDPETGCPWDVEQTFETILPYTLEEAYEVADAIHRGDRVDLEEELGDLLLQVVYHARMAEEEGAFAFPDVVRAITEKMLRRHPHVFGSPEERAAGPQKGAWDRIKQIEKALKAERKKASLGADSGMPGRPASILSDVPMALPALKRAVKLQDKAAKIGFDWPSLAPVLAKMREELGELEAELSAEAPDHDRVADEFGDLLFVMANVARHLKVDAEAALASTNEKFVRRFQRMEAWLAEAGTSPETLSLDELDALWDRAKIEERKTSVTETET